MHGVLPIKRALKRTLLAVLEGMEKVLLNPGARERIHATTTFALIFLFAVSSVDFLIAGGPEFGAPARVAQPQRLVQVSPAPAAAARQVRAEETMPTELASDLAEATSANVIALSQNLGEPLMRSPPAEPEYLIEVSARSQMALAGEWEAVEAGEAGPSGKRTSDAEASAPKA